MITLSSSRPTDSIDFLLLFSFRIIAVFLFIFLFINLKTWNFWYRCDLYVEVKTYDRFFEYVTENKERRRRFYKRVTSISTCPLLLYNLDIDKEDRVYVRIRQQRWYYKNVIILLWKGDDGSCT